MHGRSEVGWVGVGWAGLELSTQAGGWVMHARRWRGSGNGLWHLCGMDGMDDGACIGTLAQIDPRNKIDGQAEPRWKFSEAEQDSTRLLGPVIDRRCLALS